MSDNINTLLSEEPIKWVQALPEYQLDTIQKLLSNGLSFDEVAEVWLNASAENTYLFSASDPIGDKNTLLENLKRELRLFLCGDKKYRKERDSLFGDKGTARSFIVGALSVAIAPQLGVAAAVISPLIAILLASLGKVVINAWCAT